MNLDFYTRPFRNDFDYVFDAKNNFAFQFEDRLPYNKQQEIILALNSLNHEPLTEKEIEIKDGIKLHIEDKHIITIRGWGNLTGVGGYNFSGEKASGIQDNLAKYIVYKLKK